VFPVHRLPGEQPRGVPGWPDDVHGPPHDVSILLPDIQRQTKQTGRIVLRKRRTHLNRAIDNLLDKLDAEITAHESAVAELRAVRGFLLGQIEMTDEPLAAEVPDLEPVESELRQ
jgi:hypothetical protein